MNDKPPVFVKKYKKASGGYGSGLVPLLEHGDNLVIESDVVAKYVAQNIQKMEGKKDLLYPDDDSDACDLIEQFLSHWYPASDKYYNLLTANSLNEVKECEQEFKKALKSLESIFIDENNNYSKNGDFLLGEHFSLAECISAPWIQRFYVTLPYFRGIDLDDETKNNMSRLSAWMKAVCERPSVISSKCPEDEMIAAAKRYYVSYITPGARGTL